MGAWEHGLDVSDFFLTALEEIRIYDFRCLRRPMLHQVHHPDDFGPPSCSNLPKSGSGHLPETGCLEVPEKPWNGSCETSSEMIWLPRPKKGLFPFVHHLPSFSPMNMAILGYLLISRNKMSFALGFGDLGSEHGHRKHTICRWFP